MPRRKQKSKGDGSSLTPRSRTATTLEESLENLHLTVDDQLNNLVRYIVNRAGDHLTFKRNDIKKNVLPKAGGNFQEIVEKATTVLKNVYGYNVIVVDTSKNSTEYIVSNALPYVNDPTESIDEQEEPKDKYKILLLLILSHIFMSNNLVTEVSLTDFLKSLKIDIDVRHELFNSVRNHIHAFKNKKYLNIEMDPMSKKISYSWGPRAEKEISKLEILKFVSKMYKDRLPNSWVNQYKVAQEQCFENHKEGFLSNSVQQVE